MALVFGRERGEGERRERDKRFEHFALHADNVNPPARARADGRGLLPPPNPPPESDKRKGTRQVDIRLPENSHGTRPVYQDHLDYQVDSERGGHQQSGVEAFGGFGARSFSCSREKGKRGTEASFGVEELLHRTLPVQTFGHAGTNLGCASGFDLPHRM